MKKTFLKSVATGIVGITLVGGCSMFNKESVHKCSSNSCNAKKEVTETSPKTDAHKCSAKKEAHKCSAKKATAHKCSAAKTTDAKSETKTTTDKK